jgi:mono/diheme cytochrome c family protein
MRGAMAAPLVTLLLLLAGCGSAASRRSPTGQELFRRDCSVCHSLSGHSTPRQQGGDLLGVHLRRAVLTQFTAEMPVRRPLSAVELRAVVDYVATVQRQAR